MRTRIIRIGNSQGVRIPKALLERSGLANEVEIDVEVFEQAERTRHGFGGVKMTGLPTSRCKTSVERAYDGYGDAFECVNPGFFERPHADPAFDLRNEL